MKELGMIYELPLRIVFGIVAIIIYFMWFFVFPSVIIILFTLFTADFVSPEYVDIVRAWCIIYLLYSFALQISGIFELDIEDLLYD